MAAPSLAGRTFLLTGGDSGLGLAAAKSLIGRQARVLIANKHHDKGRDAVQQLRQEQPHASIEALHLDLASFDSIRQCAEQVKRQEKELHVLINNAGVFIPPDDATEEDFEVTMGINHFGPFYLTHLLLDLLKQNRPARVVNMSSLGEVFARADWKDILHGRKTDRSGLTLYGTSKAFNLLVAQELARRLRGQGIDCFGCHPGVSATPMMDKTDILKPESAVFRIAKVVGAQSPEDGAKSMLRAATDSSLTGRGFAYFGPDYVGPAYLNINNESEEQPTNPLSQDKQAAKELYDETVGIIASKAPDMRGLAVADSAALA